MVQSRLHRYMYRYGNVSTCNRVRESSATRRRRRLPNTCNGATVAGGADVTPYEDEDEPETDEDEDDVDDSDPLSFGRGSLLRYPVLDRFRIPHLIAHPLV